MSGYQIVSIEGSALEDANASYASQEFLPSDPERDRTWGVQEAGEWIALGRLQRYPTGPTRSAASGSSSGTAVAVWRAPWSAVCSNTSLTAPRLGASPTTT